MIDIVKLANGNVAIYDSTSGDFINSLSPDIVEIECNVNGSVKVVQDNGSVEYIDPAQVANTEVVPAASIPFTGNCADLAALLSSDFFFVVSGGGGSQDLASVLGIGNTSGANDIDFDANKGLLFDNNSRLREGTIDAGLGGLKGIAEICGAGYESKWEGGVRYIMGSSGNTIRQSLYNFANTPTVTDDTTKGYAVGSLWTLDNNTVYECSDATIGAAVWAIQEYNFIGFDTAAAHSVGVGEIAWNNTDGTLDLGLQGGLKNKIGQQLVVKARNTSGSLIAKGSVVKVVGVAGGFIGINLAQADNDTNSATAFGVVSEDIADTSNGFVTINGIIHGLNTNAFTEGDILYLSPTVAGEITNVKPVSPAHIVVVGYVAKKSATDGHILLHVQNGYELDELHNVTINPLTLANNDVLTYESATSLWKNKPFTNAEGWSVIVKSANQDVTNSATLTDDTELQFSVVAGGQYMIELDAVISANNTTGDYTNAFFVNSGTMKGQGIQTCNTATAVAQVVSINTNAANVSTITPMGTLIADIDMISSIKIIYSFTASANAIFSYRFSNAAAGTGRISRTWKGSILKYKKIN
jgi:hypothetical protein